MLDSMKILRLRAVYSAQGTGTLPDYLGSTVRGILGHCFREFVCDKSDMKCFLCERKEQCSYVRFFANTGGEAGAVNPFTLYVRNRGKTEWQKGDECTFELTLLGSAALQAGIYLDALKNMEKKGWGASRLQFKLLRIVEVDTERLLVCGENIWLRNLVPHEMKIQKRTAGSAVITFDTPVRIISGKKLCDSLPFEQLIHFLMRRYILLSMAYTEGNPSYDMEEFLRKAANVHIVKEEWRNVDFSRYSITQSSNKLELPAKIGWVMYEGELDVFVPLLEAGKYIHAGKNATIGFGHYEIFYDR